jgi:hypothetical protein
MTGKIGKKSDLKLKVIILLFAWTLTCAGNPILTSNGKYSDRINGHRFISVSAGAGIWSKSMQPLMNNRHIPYSFFIEYGRTGRPISLIAGTCFRTTFTLDQFLLNPNNFIAGLQYAPLRGKAISKQFNIYALGGLNICYSRFTEEIYPGIINYEYKTEKETGPGITAGFGAGYRLRSWEIKPMLFYFTGQGDFYAGHFTEQKFLTGSLQFHLSLNYRFIFNINRNTCPVYRRFTRQ